MKTLMNIALGLFLMLVITQLAMAQGAPPLPMFPDAPAAAPIDGGLGLLAAAGAGYAYRKLKNKRA
jgi:hypothetical protein